jgi:ubiquinone/menaquinone biosynthesis C-methylase UbiE
MKSLERRAMLLFVVTLTCLDPAALPARGQEKSVRPGINKPFENPNVEEFLGKFEVESREVFAKRQDIVTACKLKPGMAVGDIGAGTGLFTRLFAKAVGSIGKVFAVDIAPTFIEHIEKTCRESGIKNVTGVLCKPDSIELPSQALDLAFICDTYHHFEFPFKTMASIHRALRPGGRVVLVDFKRIPGVSSEWVLNHVRAGQEVFTKEILSAGFKVLEEPRFLTENYCLVFEKVERGQGQESQARTPNPPPAWQNVQYGPHQRNVLDFWQADSKQPTPLLVSIHGGGFVAGNKSVAPQLLKECLDAGISVAAISYRYSTQAIAPAPFQDGARAVQFLRFKAKEWNIDPKRIAATGGSAGAGISLWLGFHDDMADPRSEDPVLRQSTRLSCMAVFDGQTSYDPRFIRKLFPGKDVYKIGPLQQLFGVDLSRLDDLPAEKYQLFEEVSAINHLTKDDPPVLLSYSRPMDTEITSQGIGIHHALFGKVLKGKMDELKIPCELYAGNKRVGGGTPMRTIDFLKEHLGMKK